MKQHENVKNFLCLVRDRLNRALLYRTVQWSFLGTGIVLLAMASAFVIFGRAVPMWVYITGLSLTAIAVLAVWGARRYDLAKACRFADDFFDLHDGTVSFTKFQSQGKDGGFYELQADQVEDCVNLSDKPVNIPLGISRRVCGIALALMIAALSMGFFDDSEAVKNRRMLEELTLSSTERFNEELRKEFEDVLKDIENEHALEQINDIKNMVKDLKITSDQKKALSQYTKLESKLYKMLNSTKQRKDELLLDRISKELESTREGQDLGKQLSRKDYKEASEELKKLKLNSKNKDSKEDKKKLVKLKIIAQQMKEAAETSASNSSKNSGSKNSLSGKIKDLNETVKDKNGDQSESDSNEIDSKISDIAGELKELGIKRDIQRKMKSLVKKLREGPDFDPPVDTTPFDDDPPTDPNKVPPPPGDGPPPPPDPNGIPGDGPPPCCSGESRKPGSGGPGVGTGSVNNKSDDKTPDNKNGNITSIKGIKGQGPSEVTLEDANSGTGVVSGEVAKRKVEYKKEAEAYIQRQDVPSEVKQGVKHYFENIHETESSN